MRFLKTTVTALVLLLTTQNAAADTPPWTTLELVDGVFYVCTLEECYPVEGLTYAINEFLIDNPEALIELLIEWHIANSVENPFDRVGNHMGTGELPELP